MLAVFLSAQRTVQDGMFSIQPTAAIILQVNMNIDGSDHSHISGSVSIGINKYVVKTSDVVDRRVVEMVIKELEVRQFDQTCLAHW